MDLLLESYVFYDANLRKDTVRSFNFAFDNVQDRSIVTPSRWFFSVL